MILNIQSLHVKKMEQLSKQFLHTQMGKYLLLKLNQVDRCLAIFLFRLWNILTLVRESLSMRSFGRYICYQRRIIYFLKA